MRCVFRVSAVDLILFVFIVDMEIDPIEFKFEYTTTIIFSLFALPSI